MKTKRKIAVLAHNIRSLWNVGSFFRTCDAFAVEKLWLTGYTAAPPMREISKTAIGAEVTVPWEHGDDPMTVIKGLKREGWSIVALEQTEASVSLSTWKPTGDICLVLGHEVSGVPEEILRLCDQTVEITMHGTKESLNVSVAAGIALHHIRNF